MSFANEEYQRRLNGPWCDTKDHLRFLFEAVMGYFSPVVIELGVHVGNTTSALLAAAELTNGVLWSADVAADTPELVPPEFLASPVWHLLIGDDCSPEVLAQMPVACDVLFVDSFHTTEHTLAVMEAYIPRVLPGGVALFHDTEWEHPDVQLPGPTGVVAAGIMQYCSRHGLTWENHPGCYGLGVIRL